MKNGNWKPSSVNPNPTVLFNSENGDVDVHWCGIDENGGVHGQFHRFSAGDALQILDCFDQFTPDEMGQIIEKLKKIRPELEQLRNS